MGVLVRGVPHAGVRRIHAQLEQPDWRGDGGENSEKDPGGVSESERCREEACQRIGESPPLKPTLFNCFAKPFSSSAVVSRSRALN